MTVKENGCKGVDDVQYNGNEEELGDQEKVGQNASLYDHQLQYVV
jgi:hypothetical protein